MLYFFNIRMECEKKFDGIFYSVLVSFTGFKRTSSFINIECQPLRRLQANTECPKKLANKFTTIQLNLKNIKEVDFNHLII